MKGQQKRLRIGQMRAECPSVRTSRLEATATLRSTHLLGSIPLSHQTSKAILSPDFPFVLKGRSYDCQPQSSDPDLGVYLFLLEANFYALSHPHRRGKIITRTHSSPTAGTLLFNSPGSALRYFSSAKLVFAHLSSPG